LNAPGQRLGANERSDLAILSKAFQNREKGELGNLAIGKFCPPKILIGFSILAIMGNSSPMFSTT
jgi:hypothetical protein